MANKLLDDQRDYLIEKHRSGVTVGELSREFKVTAKVIVRVLGDEYRPGRHRLIDADRLIAAYLSGSSEAQVAKTFGVGRRVVRLRLLRAGITPRSASEAEKLKWSQMSEEQKANQVRAANEAARGRKHSLEEKLQRAKTREAAPTVNVSRYEVFLRNEFDRLRIPYVLQKAIGPYNCDIASFPVAVEVWGGNWHFGGSHMARTPERIRYLLDAGWNIYIQVVSSRFPLTSSVADYVTSYVEATRRNPPKVCEYRVVWGAGKFSTGGCAEDDKISIVVPFTGRRDPRTGQYKTIPR